MFCFHTRERYDAATREVRCERCGKLDKKSTEIYAAEHSRVDRNREDITKLIYEVLAKEGLIRKTKPKARK